MTIKESCVLNIQFHNSLLVVIAGFIPANHGGVRWVFDGAERLTANVLPRWVAGTSPAMTLVGGIAVTSGGWCAMFFKCPTIKEPSASIPFTFWPVRRMERSRQIQTVVATPKEWRWR